MNRRPVERAEFEQATRRLTTLTAVVACAFLLIVLLVVAVIASLNTRAKTNRLVDVEQSITRAVTLCRKQNTITDTLVQAAIQVVSAPPNPPEDRVFIAVFSAQHEILTDPKTCNALEVRS